MIFYLRSCVKFFMVAGIFSLFINTLYLTFSLYMLAVYTRVLGSYSFSTLYVMTAMALGALAVLSALDFCRSRLLIQAGVRLDRLLTGQVLRAMLKDLSRIDGQQYNRGIQDINTLRNYLGGNAVFAFFDVPWIFIYLWIIYLVHPVLGLTATGGAVVTLAIGLLQNRLTRKDADAAAALNIQGQQWLSTGFRTAAELQSMGMIHHAADGYCRINDQAMHIQDGVDRKNHFFTAMSRSFGTLMQVLIFGVGAALVLLHEAGSGVIIASSIIMGRALAPVTQGIGAWQQTSGARSAYNNLKRILDTADRKNDHVPADIAGELVVENVALEINESSVLTGVDFHLKPGEIMGLAGPNGAGKTSLCRIVLGMWTPTGGAVTLDGRDVTTLDSDTLGRFLGYLPQNVELFSGTVGENIARMGTVDADKVVDAARRAGAHELILGFPDGYETDIGEAGQSLSGGQRQRVALARALYGDPRLIILDEPNSNLDEEGEKALLDTLKSLKQRGVTTIMITHKPALLQSSDKILVLENGHMVRFGGREQFMAPAVREENR